MSTIVATIGRYSLGPIEYPGGVCRNAWTLMTSIRRARVPVPANEGRAA